MKIVIIALQSAVTLLTMANPVEAQSLKHEIPMVKKECSAILAGMANDAKDDPSVSVTYKGASLILVGNGRHYLAECKGDRIYFSGSNAVN